MALDWELNLDSQVCEPGEDVWQLFGLRALGLNSLRLYTRMKFSARTHGSTPTLRLRAGGYWARAFYCILE